jgi:hypothetical protein
VNIMTGLTKRISSINTFLFNWRSDDSGCGGDYDNNSNKCYLLLLINNNYCIAETC